MKEKEFFIRRGITDNHPRQLVLNENFIKFENKDLVNNQFTLFQKDEIAEYCFGVKWMRYYFVFGREYIISIRDINNRVIKINFKTYFGRKKSKYHDLCNEILNDLWFFYFDKITSNFINKLQIGEEIQIGEVTLNKDGLYIITNSSIKQKKAFIPWEKVSVKNYTTYSAIYSVDDAININRGYSFLNDWNTAVLQSVIKYILEKKNIQ